LQLSLLSSLSSAYLIYGLMKYAWRIPEYL